MAYELHIMRPPFDEENKPTPIPLDEWKEAVLAVDGVRLCPTGSRTVFTLKTGLVLEIPRLDGDCEVYFADGRAWLPALRWFEGAAHFKGVFEPGDPVWSAAAALASRLNAVIRGDEGETYDLRSGEVVGT
jgi:hypothetical protein